MLCGVLYYFFFALTVVLAGTDLNVPQTPISEISSKDVFTVRDDDSFVTNRHIYNKVLYAGEQIRSSLMTVVNNWKLKEKRCSLWRGGMGEVYYRYSPVNQQCKTKSEEEKIKKAIHRALLEFENSWLSKYYCIIMSEHNTWRGTLTIGPSRWAYFVLCKGLKLKFYSIEKDEYYEKSESKVLLK